MRVRFCSCALLFVLFLPAASRADKYTLRDLGFIETDPRPFRLLIIHDEATALQAEQKRIELQKILQESNVVVIRVPLDQRKHYPELKNVPLPNPLVKPLFWLVAPDNRQALFDTPDAPSELTQSPLRHEIVADVARSLCGVVLLESTDNAANARAKTKAERVLTQINKVKKRLEKAPAGEIKLRTVPVAMRRQERWTLWSLGENAAPLNVPRIVVIYGNMRRAGSVFDGVEWDEADLFARFAMLGQWYEHAVDRGKFFGPGFLFRKSKEWREQLAETLHFDPHSDKVKAEATAILEKAPVPDPRRNVRPPTFNELLAGIAEQEHEEENQPKGEPNAVDARKNDEDEPEQKDGLEPDKANPLNPVAIVPRSNEIILVAGVLGWILLAVSVWIIERRQPHQE